MCITATRKVSNWFIELISKLKVSGVHYPLGPTVDMPLLTFIMLKQEEDDMYRQLKQFSQKGWPNQHEVPEALKPYYPVSAELTVYKGLLMLSNRIVIPSCLREDMLDM